MLPLGRFFILPILLIHLIGQATGLAATEWIENGSYSNPAAVQQAWSPLSGSLPVSTVSLEGHTALRLKCNFSGTKIERACWDKKVQLDLSSCRGIEFKMRCSKPHPVAYFSIYFQSGNGWYHASFFPESTTEWSTVTVNKANAAIEGKPAGWGQIKTIRISAWRGRDEDTEFYLCDMRKVGALGSDAIVAILRADSAVQGNREEARGVSEYSERVAQNFDALSIGCSVVSDLDVTPELLRQAKLVVLPYNPSMPPRVAEQLAGYAQGGGKLLIFYIVPEKLRSLCKVDAGKHVRASRPGGFAKMQITAKALPGAPDQVGQQSWNITAFQPLPGGRVLAEWLDDQGQATGYPAILGSSEGIVMTHVLLSDDAANKRRLLLALAGQLAPDIWREAAERSLARLGQVSRFKNFEEAAAQIPHLAPKKKELLDAVASAGMLRGQALTLIARKSYPEAMAKAADASQQIERAYYLAQNPLPGEFRAFWCHSAFGVDGMEWDEAIRRLSDNGFTAIAPNMLWGGVAYYESKLLPVAPEVKVRGDQIAKCLAACRKYGVQIHVWKVNWNLGHAVRPEFLQQMRQAGRLQANSRGQEEPWLCPSHPENQKLEIDSMLEVARNYDVDGIHFDYIRYPDSDHCFCTGCKERFEKASGLTLKNWPGQLLAEGEARQAWREWRCGNITTVVKGVSEQARPLKPKLKISAAVFRNWTTDRDTVGQDWKIWCDKGYMDFVCPMDYTPITGSFENMLTQQVQWAGKVPCYPGIGVSASSSHFGPDRVIEQILVTRKHKTKGFIIFNYGVTESKDLLPTLGLGITRRTVE